MEHMIMLLYLPWHSLGFTQCSDRGTYDYFALKCAPCAGLHKLAVETKGQGLYTAEVCCRQAGLVTVIGKLNDRGVGCPETLLIKASTACKLQVTHRDPIWCTAGVASCHPHSWFASHDLINLRVQMCIWSAKM